MGARQILRYSSVLASGRFSRSEAPLLMLLFFLAVLAYANTLAKGFVYDDYPQLVCNPTFGAFTIGVKSSGRRCGPFRVPRA